MSGSNPEQLWNLIPNGPTPLTGQEQFLAAQTASPSAPMYRYPASSFIESAISASGVNLVINIASLGAKSNGTTDDSPALNAAIAAIIASPTGGIILIPSGRTLIASAITASIPAGVALTIQGLGVQASELYFSNATPGLSFTLLNSGGTSGAWGRVNLNSFTLTRGPASPPIASTGISIQADPTVSALCGVGGSFRDLAIIGSSLGSTGWANSFILQGGGGCSFDNVYIRGVNAGSLGDLGDALLNITGTLVGGTFKQFATNNNIVNCTLQGGSVGLLVSGYAQGVAVTNSTIIGQYDSVRWIGGASPNLFAEELDIVNASLNGIHRGIYVSLVNSCSFVGCTILHFAPITGLDWAGIQIDQAGLNSASGNTITGSHVATEVGILVSNCGGSVGSLIGPNTVIGNNTYNFFSGTSRGVYLSGTTNNTIVIGNNFSGAAGSGHVSQDTPGNNVVFGNMFNGVVTAVQPLMVFEYGLNTNGPLTTIGGIYQQSTTPGNNILFFEAGGIGTPTFAFSVAATGSTYDTSTGITELTTTAPHGIAALAAFTVSGLAGTGSFASLDGKWVATSVTSTTITFTGPIGLGTVTITGGTVAAGVGTKITLFPAQDTSDVDYAIGYGGNFVWQSVAQNITGNFFSWYGGTTQVAKLDGTGNLSLLTLPASTTYANDAAAAAGGVAVGQLYRNGSVVQVRVS